MNRLKCLLLSLCFLFPGLLSGFPEIEAGIDFHSLRKLIMPSPKLREYDRFFSPLLFIPYRDQLRACVSDALKQQPGLLQLLDQERPLFVQVRHFLQLTEESVPAHAKSHRDWHHRWLKQLREILAAKELGSKRADPGVQKINRLMDRICLWMYSEPDFFDGFADVLKLELRLSTPVENIDSSYLSKILEKSWKKLKQKDAVSGFKKVKNDPDDTHLWDPHLGGMLPTRLFSVGSTQLIYTPRIVHEQNNAVEISPEFLRYLNALSAEGKSHLYINLMNRTDDKEKALCRKIEGLELKEKAFHAITLDHNSDFYKQRHTSLENSQDFKSAFFGHLFSNAYYWSKTVDHSQWRMECKQIIETIHADYFQKKSTLTTAERRAFIDVTYIALIRALFSKHGFDHANISCKHSMDRAPQLTSLLFADEVVRLSWSRDSIEKFLALILAPPLLSHNRAALERHIERITETLPFISGYRGSRRGQ